MFNQCPVCYNETTIVYEDKGQNLCPSCFIIDEFGGEGSGNFEHGGRPGEVGGSGEGGSPQGIYEGTVVEDLKDPAFYDKQIRVLQKQYPDLVVPDDKVMNMRNGWQSEVITGGLSGLTNTSLDLLVAKSLYVSSAQDIVDGKQEHNEETKSLYKNMQNSQKFAKEQLIDSNGEIIVYRGIGGPKGKAIKTQILSGVKDVNFETATISSFSLSAREASRAGNNRGFSSNTIIIRQKIKVEHVFDVPFMSGNFKDEREIVVINKEKKLSITSSDVLYNNDQFGSGISGEILDKFDLDTVINIDETEEDRDWLHIRK